MTKLTLPFLETMITQACNLSCEGCTNYSDLKHQGYVTWAQGREWLSSWLERIHISDFGIMGGEPLINPEFRSWLTGVRKLLPESQIRFTTNGLLLDRNWDIVDLMHDLGNISFKLTVHVVDETIEKVIQKIFDSFDWKPVTEYGLDRWITTNNFRFHIKRPEKFVKTFRNDYKDMAPWHTNPNDAFDLCVQKTCPLLYQGSIYKCSTAGLLQSVLQRHNMPNNNEWQQYIPSALTPDCDQSLLEQFIENFGSPHHICGQCPDQTKTMAVLIHADTVTFK
jgi:sulfatase maturation enzyme AslB (radical SAM superfamily)